MIDVVDYYSLDLVEAVVELAVVVDVELNEIIVVEAVRSFDFGFHLIGYYLLSAVVVDNNYCFGELVHHFGTFVVVGIGLVVVDNYHFVVVVVGEKVMVDDNSNLVVE
jgi:hypothetical protein